jgi:Trm5-related predicted tRNA methylase
MCQEEERMGMAEKEGTKVSRQKRYEETEKGQEARLRARKAQDEKKRRQRLMQAEQRRVDRLIREGVVESMSASEKREWLEACRDVNPVLYDVLREKGVA